jgi:hypothetical protein
MLSLMESEGGVWEAPRPLLLVDFPDFPYGAILGTLLRVEGTAAFRELVDTGHMREMQNHADRISGYIA